MTGVEIAFHHERPIDPQAVRELYTSVDWWPLRTPEEIAQVLKDALAVGAWRVITWSALHALFQISTFVLSLKMWSCSQVISGGAWEGFC